AVISVLFLASFLHQTHGCFSKNDCCTDNKIDTLGKDLQVSDPIFTSPSAPVSATDCQALSKGTVAQRSISPWSYWKDFNATRYPQNLWQASCSCDHCLSFRSSPRHDASTYNSLEKRGNSVTVRSSILVFYRKECPGREGLFYLQPHNYELNVSCACVVPRYSSKGRK
ncbi:interleukin-25, partial [Notechis scutatus]|uniref:Interleukin-25 n=1 Tax=Notechis scutatus TaxID=8663 RepID=A0A6J1VY71_9SAUR